MRVLLIKFTSFGDLIHALPAITDASLAHPGIIFDWVIDESFQQVATWHSSVDRIFTTNHRKWRERLTKFATYRSIYSLVRNLRKTKYDLIIDGQGNFKTALLASCLKGTTAGFDKESVREPIAHLAYKKKYRVPKRAHAVERLRRLFALALDYPLSSTPPSFSIDQLKFFAPPLELPSSYLFFVHNASWQTKLWPEEHWISLIQKCTAEGHTILLPWGNQEELARAQRLAATSNRVIVLPRLSLSELGYILARADASVCVDTGLSHLAAALNIPSITLYGATDSGLIGATGLRQTYFESNLPCAPCNQKICRLNQGGLQPPCLAAITPDQVFARLSHLFINN